MSFYGILENAVTLLFIVLLFNSYLNSRFRKFAKLIKNIPKEIIKWRFQIQILLLDLLEHLLISLLQRNVFVKICCEHVQYTFGYYSSCLAIYRLKHIILSRLLKKYFINLYLPGFHCYQSVLIINLY